MVSQIITDKIANPAGSRTDAVHFLQSETAAGQSELDFLLPDGYIKFELIYTDVIPTVDAATMALRVSDDNGASFDSGASDYSAAYSYIQLSNGTAADYGVTTTYAGLSLAAGASSGEFTSGKTEIFNPRNASIKTAGIHTNIMAHNNGNFYRDTGGWIRNSASAVNAVRVFFTTGSFSAGTFKLYGWVE